MNEFSLRKKIGHFTWIYTLKGFREMTQCNNLIHAESSSPGGTNSTGHCTVSRVKAVEGNVKA